MRAAPGASHNGKRTSGRLKIIGYGYLNGFKSDESAELIESLEKKFQKNTGSK